jgi:DNA-binding NtrC family response regulator
MQPEVTLHPAPADHAEGIEDVERQMIVAALQACGGNKSHAAKRLPGAPQLCCGNAGEEIRLGN